MKPSFLIMTKSLFTCKAHRAVLLNMACLLASKSFQYFIQAVSLKKRSSFAIQWSMSHA